MGSRAIVIACRNNEAARKRFGITGTESGVCYTRTGRSFFSDTATEAALLERVAAAVEKAGLWRELATDWICLDCELMPWSAKAQALLKQQYAPVGVAAELSLPAAVALLSASDQKLDGLDGILTKFRSRLEAMSLYRDAYRQYCWPVKELSDYKLAPFHVLASEGSFNLDKDHLWHMTLIERLCDADPGLLRKTPYKLVETGNVDSCQQAETWWTELTSRGGEGMVVKPLGFTVKGAKRLVQPGIKCRGAEYLRIIYGPEYTLPEHLERLRSRGLSGKRSLALREYALGYEALKRFVKLEPHYRVHEAVFGVLALESEPVDPRL